MHRHSGQSASPRLVKAIGELQARDHPCLIYETSEELLSVVVPFLRFGWERGERCLYFAPEPCIGGILKDLDSAGIESGTALVEGSLLMPNIHTIYKKHDPFAPDKVLEFLARAIIEAKDDGFSGLRLVGEMPWTLEGISGVEPLIEYEAKLNDFIHHHEIPVMCLYDRTRFLPEVLLDAVRTHPKLIFGSLVSKSYFYLPPDQFFHSKRPEIEVDHLLRGMGVNEELVSALEEREALLNAVVGNSPDSIFVKDLEGRYLMINPAGAAYLGKRVDDVVGHRDSELSLSECAQKIFKLDLHGLACGKPISGEEEIDSAAGTRFFHATKGVYCDAKGGVAGLFGIVRDITERKNAENLLREQKLQLEEINVSLSQRVADAVLNLRKKDQMMIQQGRQAAMGDMIGNIAHQWRQPLNTLGLIVQELLMAYGRTDFKKETLEASVEKAMNVIQHMSKTINDFSNYFKPDRGKTLFNANQSLARTLSLIEPGFKQLNIAVEIVEEEQAEINGYENEYAQVLLNILVNSRDAFEERNIDRRRVITVSVFREGEKSVVTVADSAGGIPEDVIDKIFDPYFTTKGPDKGTGIGLYMAKTIIEKNMGGSLTVRNTADGAEFRIAV